MSITDYTSLKASIADTLLRTDLTAVIPSFITLAEAHIARRLRHWKMEKRSEAMAVGQYTDLPEDWRATKRFKPVGGRALKLASLTEVTNWRAASDTPGTPAYYAHVAGELEIYPTPASETTMELLYTADIPRLSDAATTSWLLTDAPDLYLYGSLIHSAPYLKDDARLAVWGGLYRDALEGMNSESEKATASGSGLVRRA